MKPSFVPKILSAILLAASLATPLVTQAQVNTNPVPNPTISWTLDVWGFQGTTGGNGLPVPLPAGLALATNWNDGWQENYSHVSGVPPTTVTNLYDMSGSTTAVSITYAAWTGSPVIGGSNPAQDADGSYNKQMMNGYLNAGPAGWNPNITNSYITISNIPYAQYDVVAYFNADNAGRHSTIDNGTTTYSFSTLGASAINGANALFKPTTETNGSVFPSANFAFFPGMTGSTCKLTQLPKSGNDQWLGLIGFQVIQSSNVYVLYGPAPATQIVPLGQPANFSVMAGGKNRSYQWRHNGNPIVGATNSTYSISATAIGQDGNYDVVLANSFSSATSSVAGVTFYTPKTVEWAGNGSTWDTSSLFWTVNQGASTTNYTETDNTLFSPRGVANNIVALASTLTPSLITVSNATYTLTSGTLAGAGSLRVKNNGTLILDTMDTRTGPTVIDNGSTFQLDNGDTAGGMGAGALTNNGTLLFNAAGDEGYAYPIYGTGNITNVGPSGQITLGGTVHANHLVQSGSGTLLLQGDNALTGGLVVMSGTVLARGPNVLGNAPVVVAGGELQLIYSFDFVVPLTTLAGGLLHGGISGSETLEGPVILAVSSEIDVNNGSSFTLNGAISGGGFGLTLGGGGGTLILNQAYNSLDNLTLNAGTVAFNSTANITLTNPISGGGNLAQTGSGTLTVTGDVSGLSGTITVLAGTLAGTFTSGGPASVVMPGTLAPGTPSAIGTMTINGGLTLGGNLAVKVNKSLVQSNDVIVTSSANNTNNGVVTVKNLGSALTVGDTFTLVSTPVSGGDTLTVLGAGVIWTNNLALDGSITVLSTTVPKPVITSTMASASTLIFSGNNGYPSSPYAVLSATNLTGPWTVVTTGTFSGTGTFSVTNAIMPGVPQTFYRLQQ